MKIQVHYEGGESRYGKNGIDYMLAKLDADAYGADELYAEVNPHDYCDAAGLTVEELDALYEDGGEAPEAVNDATYAALKSMILEQAQEIGVPADMLEFP